MTSLAQSFMAVVPRSDIGEASAVETAIADAVAAAQQRWPQIEIEAERFSEELAERLRPDEPVAAGIAKLHAADLYLALGCRLGDPEALAAFDKEYLSRITAAAIRVDLGSNTADEVRQRIRDRLLVPRDDGDVRIATYGGRGELGGWLRVVATREALMMARKDRRLVAADDDELMRRADVTDDPEFELMRARYRDDFRAAFRDAFDGLTPKDRNLLRYQLIDGLGVEQIAALHQVHRATASRWLAGVRDTLYRQTRGGLMRRLEIDRGEFESILRLIRSQLHASVRRFLQDDGTDA